MTKLVIIVGSMAATVLMSFHGQIANRLEEIYKMHVQRDAERCFNWDAQWNSCNLTDAGHE